MSKPDDSLVGRGEEFPKDIAGLEKALLLQREYTLALYADLPESDWVPAAFPYLEIVNPPLWELAHLAWFAEFFCLRWHPDDAEGARRPSSLAGADALFDSRKVPHRERWRLAYPSRADCMRYMERALEDVLAGLRREGTVAVGRDPYQLAVAHEDMHAEALLMTLRTLDRAWPECAPRAAALDRRSADLSFPGGVFHQGASSREFRFDNELPETVVELPSFALSSRPVNQQEWREFRESSAYDDERLWTPAGLEWKQLHPNHDSASGRCSANSFDAAMHINAFEAAAFCGWAGRRLPTEAEWELAATCSAAFFASTGQVWEWTADPFLPRTGFVAGRYADYSRPWFGDHQVLKGGSFATHPRLKYPQYRNFYSPSRSDMFCGFRTAAR